jgi:uncharacterized protein
MSEANGNDMGRRSFLRNSAIGVGAGLLGGANLINAATPEKKEQDPTDYRKIKEYRTLGRTGFKVSDIGCGYVKDPAVLEQLLDAGVNYIDSAESYKNEQVIGQVIKNRDRKKLFITTKLEIKDKEPNTKEFFLKRARQCLERLQTDYVDCMMAHSIEQVKMIGHPEFHAAMKQLKNEGKIKHLGISNHGTNWYINGPETMEKVLIAAAKDGRFDVMLMAYNFVQEDNGAKVLEVLKEKNIGATLMKVNPIGKLPRTKQSIEKYKAQKKEVPPHLLSALKKLEAKKVRAQAFIDKYKLHDQKRMRDAAIRFVLENPAVHSVCCGFISFDHLDFFLPLSGTRLSDMEKVKLAAYKEGMGPLYCRHACAQCEAACPHHVPVNTIMRYNHYFEAQGKEKFALKSYANLNTPKADLCATCSGHCEAACPHGVSVHGLLNLAHHTLSLA